MSWPTSSAWPRRVGAASPGERSDSDQRAPGRIAAARCRPDETPSASPCTKQCRAAIAACATEAGCIESSADRAQRRLRGRRCPPNSPVAQERNVNASVTVADTTTRLSGARSNATDHDLPAGLATGSLLRIPSTHRVTAPDARRAVTMDWRPQRRLPSTRQQPDRTCHPAPAARATAPTSPTRAPAKATMPTRSARIARSGDQRGRGRRTCGRLLAVTARSSAAASPRR